MGLQRKAKGIGVLCFQLTSCSMNLTYLSLSCERSTACVRPDGIPLHLLCNPAPASCQDPKAGLEVDNSCPWSFVEEVINPAALSIATWKQDNISCWSGVLVWLKTLVFSTMEYFPLLKCVTKSNLRHLQATSNAGVQQPMVGSFLF